MTVLIDTTKRQVPSVMKGSYYLTQPRKPWLVSGMIRQGTTAFLSAKEGTGKSFVALELAYCVAEGHAFFGNEVQQGDVLYNAAERGDQQRERLEALRDLKGYNPDSVTFLDYSFKFNVPDDEALFRESVKAAGITPKLIIIDTLRASFEGDENNSWNAHATMEALTRIRRVYDATILLLHHVNGFGKSRGSSAFIGSADTELYMTESRAKNSQKVYMTVRKQNNGKKWLRYELSPQEIDFGNDYSSIVFNLDAVKDMDQSPSEEEESNEREQNIITVLELAGGTVTSLRKMQDGIKDIEGTLPNRETLKDDLKRMADKEMIIFEMVQEEGRAANQAKTTISLPETAEV